MPLQSADRFRLAWIAVGAVLAVVLAAVAYAFVGALVFGLFLYYATRPAHRQIRNYVDQPTVAAVLALFALALPLILLVAYVVSVALQELSGLATGVDLGPYAATLDPYLNVTEAVRNPQSLVQDPENVQAGLDALLSALSYLGVVGSGLLSLFIAFALAFYLLRDGHRLRAQTGLVADERGVLDAYASAVDENLSTIFFGNILNALLTGVIGAVAFSLLNLAAPDAFAIPSPALIGLLAGAASLVPVVGMKIVYVPLVLYLAGRAAMTGTGWGFVALVTGVSVLIVDLVPDMLLRPYVSGGDLHTGTVMFAYILGPTLFGWYGLFLGPLILVLAAQFVRLVLPELVAGERIRPESVEPPEDSQDGTGESATPASDGEEGTTSEDAPQDDATGEDGSADGA
jgi:predicted PurR-regulated permease PerM